MGYYIVFTPWSDTTPDSNLCRRKAFIPWRYAGILCHLHALVGQAENAHISGQARMHVQYHASRRCSTCD